MQNLWYMPIIKIFFMNISIIYTYLKISNRKITKIMDFIVYGLFNAIMIVIYIQIKSYIQISLTYLLYYFLFTMFFFVIMKSKLSYTSVVSAISIAIALSSMLIATIINFIILKIIGIDIRKQTMTEYVIIGIIQFALLYFFFRIRRFKNGFSFIKSEKIKIFSVAGVCISIILIFILIYTGINKEDTITDTICMIGIVLRRHINDILDQEKYYKIL